MIDTSERGLLIDILGDITNKLVNKKMPRYFNSHASLKNWLKHVHGIGIEFKLQKHSVFRIDADVGEADLKEMEFIFRVLYARFQWISNDRK